MVKKIKHKRYCLELRAENTSIKMLLSSIITWLDNKKHIKNLFHHKDISAPREDSSHHLSENSNKGTMTITLHPGLIVVSLSLLGSSIRVHRGQTT